MKQLTDHEYVVSDQFERQIVTVLYVLNGIILIMYCQQSREQKYAAVRTILEENVRIRNQAEERFQAFFEREVHELHNNVRTESEVSF